VNRTFPNTAANLSTGELADIVGGRLRLGSMPPLGGDLEPVGRFAIDSRSVQPGDVFWGLSTQPDRGNLAEEAFARGALGVVVSGRRVEPWAGRFSIEVDDPKWALWQLGRTMRSRYDGRVIAVVGGVGKTLTRSMIETVLQSELAGVCADDTARHADFLHVGLPLELAELDDDAHDYALLELHGDLQVGDLHGPRGELEAQLRLCQPDIVVVTPGDDGGNYSQDTNHWSELAETLSEETVVVLCDDACSERSPDAARRRTMRVGRGADCDLVAEHVECAGDELSIVLTGLTVRVPVWGRHHLP
jgi:UDP-N-acetylmuramoyl-tripeptide--D-alanyl-D-alanine ligase